MIDVVYDAEGVRRALEEILEEDYVRSRIERDSADAAPETRARMEAQIPLRTLSPGYYTLGDYLLQIEGEQKAGVPLGALAGFEVRGLVALRAARAAFNYKHPPCSGCGAHQHNRFGAECQACGAKIRRKKG